MATLPLALGCGFLLCLVLTPVAAYFARRVGLMDKPDGGRKIHARPIPLAGGLAVFASICVTLVTAWFWSPIVANWFAASHLSLTGFIGSGAILCLVGVIDDRFVLRGRHKLVGQLLAVGVLLASGVTVRLIDLFGLNVQLGNFAMPVTVFWLLGAINSLNLIDGMDGMSGCVGGGIAAAIAALSLVTGQFAAALVALTLVGAIVGFLCFNLPPARVFLGDCGSSIIGMIIGVLSLHSALKGPTTVMLTIPMALFTLPIFDTAAAIARRTLTGRSIYTTDRGHLHHCLERSGFSRRRVLVLVSFLCLLTGLGAFASLVLQRQLFAAVSALTVIGTLVITRLFGYSEMVLMRKRLCGYFIRMRYAHDESRTHDVSVHLQGTANWGEHWTSLTEAACQFQLSSICLDLNIPAIHERYHARWDRLGKLPPDAQVWKFEGTLANRGRHHGRIELRGLIDEMPVHEKISIFVKIAEDIELSISLLVDGPKAPTPIRAIVELPSQLPATQPI